MTWTGADGSVWDLLDWRSGICLLLDGVTGLHNPTITKYQSRSRAVPGHRNRGWRAESRDVFWPLYFYGDGSDEWLDVYARFFATVHPERAGVWAVTAGTQTRRLSLTGVFDSEHQFARDPYLDGWATIPVELEPAQPFWEGDPVTAGPFSAGDGEIDFIDDEDGAPSFHISPAATFASATIANPGDVESYLIWTITGPLDSVEVGVGDVTATVPFEIESDEVLRIDTDPRNVAATLNGVDVTAELGLVEFDPVPAGGSAALTIVASGEGSVQGTLTPLFFRGL